jgi:hypothetical protein
MWILHKVLVLSIFLIYGQLKALVITNKTQYPVTFRIVTSISDMGSQSKSFDPMTLVNGESTQDIRDDLGTAFHIDVKYEWGSNSNWAKNMINTPNRDWGFSYTDNDKRDVLEFRWNPDYNAPVLWNTKDRGPYGNIGWWLYQR